MIYTRAILSHPDLYNWSKSMTTFFFIAYSSFTYNADTAPFTGVEFISVQALTLAFASTLAFDKLLDSADELDSLKLVDFEGEW